MNANVIYRWKKDAPGRDFLRLPLCAFASWIALDFDRK
jgi:hypothetical protein